MNRTALLQELQSADACLASAIIAAEFHPEQHDVLVGLLDGLEIHATKARAAIAGASHPRRAMQSRTPFRKILTDALQHQSAAD